MVIIIFIKTQSLNIFELFWERLNQIQKRYYPTRKPYTSIPAVSDTDAIENKQEYLHKGACLFAKM